MTLLRIIRPDISTKALSRREMLQPQQRGFTLVEVMVALVISLMIALAAIAALVVSRKGFSTVDASSQLRDNGRFSADLLQRIAVQGGFKDWLEAAKSAPPAVAGASSNPDPNITGFNNAVIDTSDPVHASTARAAGVDGYGSDILVLRYQVAETFPGSGVADSSMIDCAGNSSTAIPTGRYDRLVSIVHVAIDQGEPTLMCTYSTAGGFATVPIVQGVENFQVLYGTDGVVAGTATATATTSGTPNAYLRADQLTVSGNAVATNNNWRRVRSLRIGMILRGPLNSAQERVAQTPASYLYPLGQAKSSSTGAAGSALSSSGDDGTKFQIPADGRLRQVVTFTVHLRNDQGL